MAMEQKVQRKLTSLLPKEVCEILAGTAAGAAQTLVGHPFITIKVRLQTSPDISSAGCVKDLLAKEGVFGFYKGMASPLCGVGLINAFAFFANENAKRVLTRGGREELTMPKIVLGGVFAGVAQSLIASPIELLMVRLQNQYVQFGGQKVYNGPVHCAKLLVQQEGFAGLYRGLCSTVIREIPNWGAYFGVYGSLRKFFPSESPLALLASGGVAGIVAQLAQLPFDRVKSIIQTSVTKQRFLPVLRSVLQSEGFVGLYRGIAPVLLRAFPANAATFYVFEKTMKHLKQ